MRSMKLIFTAAVFVGVFALAADLNAGCGSTRCNGAANGCWGSHCYYSPCYSYNMAPGCCQYYRPCCDNAWAGYCEHKAKVQAFWARVGTPRPPRPRRAWCSCLPWATPCCEQTSPCTESAPPSDLEPTPTPPEPAKPAKNPQAGNLGKLFKMF